MASKIYKLLMENKSDKHECQIEEVTKALQLYTSLPLILYRVLPESTPPLRLHPGEILGGLPESTLSS